MDKVISATNYWQQFGEKYPDVEPFRSFISADPILAKICEFAATPNIFLTIETDYPFDEKLAELSTITKEDIAHLSNLNIRTGYSGDKEKISEWLAFLDNLFRLVSTTLCYYGNGKHQLNIDDGLIREETIQSFKKQFSVCGFGVSEGKKGQRYNWQRIGFALPNAELFIKEIPGTPPKVICEIHYLRKPTREEVLSAKKVLGIGSIENFRRFRPMTDEICYGGFHPYLDQRAAKSESPKYLIRFFYKGRKLKESEFNYSIRKRYAEKLKKAAGKDEEWRDRLTYIETRLIKAIATYDRNKKAPGSFLREHIQWALQDYYKSISTEGFDNEYFPEEDNDDNLRLPQGPRRISRNKIEHSGGTVETLNEETLAEKDPCGKMIDSISLRDMLLKGCRDETDRKIIDALLNDASWKEDGEINFTEVARQVDTYRSDACTRWENILKRMERIKP